MRRAQPTCCLSSVARRRGPAAQRSWKDGRALHSGVLEDYANLADGLLALYEATLRRALLRGGARARRHDPRRTSLTRPAVSSTRPTTTRRSSRGPRVSAGQRRAVGRGDGRDRAARARRIYRRAAGTRNAANSAIAAVAPARSALPDGLRAVAQRHHVLARRSGRDRAQRRPCGDGYARRCSPSCARRIDRSRSWLRAVRTAQPCRSWKTGRNATAAPRPMSVATSPAALRSLNPPIWQRN